MDALFGESGTRTEVVEWGVRWTRDIPSVARKGHVDLAASEAYARDRAAYLFGGEATEVVSRTVVTYTQDWLPQGGA